MLKIIEVNTAAEMETKSLYYLTKGFFLLDKSERKIVLRKDKELNPILVALGFIFFVIPLIIYLLIHWLRDKIHIVEIRVK
jgi:hypothetical protein